MRKYFIIILFVICIFSLFRFIYYKQEQNPNLLLHDTNLSNDDVNFIINNDIDLDNLKKYLPYKNFNLYNYFHYEKLRTANNYSHLSSINFYNNPNYYDNYINPKKALFIDSPLILVNKSFYLTKDYVPSNLLSVLQFQIKFLNDEILLKKEALENYQIMYDNAKNDNIHFYIYSGYRSYDRQHYLYYTIYNDDTISARPGHSEHQTGYAIDISTLDAGLTLYFEKTKEYDWLINNCFKYGFILRYPKGKEIYTSYVFEPWHFRYVGDIARFITENDLTLEQYIIEYLEI